MFVNVVILVSVLLYLFYKYMCRNFDYWKKRNVFYIKPVPIVGNFLDVMLLRKSIGNQFAEIYNKTKEPLVGVFAFDKPHLILRSPELIKTVLIKDSSFFDERSMARGKDPIFSKVLFVSKNPEWKLIRNKLSPAFTSGKLKVMIPLIHQVSEKLTKYIDKTLSQSHVDSKEIATKYMIDIIGVCAFGIDAHSFDDENAEFRAITRTVMDFDILKAIQQSCYIFMPYLADLLHMNFVPSKASEFFKRVFWDMIKARDESVNRNDIIDVLIQMGKDETMKKKNLAGQNQILAQAVQIFLAGFETTSSTIAFTLHELCLNRELQDRLRNEIIHSLDNGGFTYDNVMEMKYLHMCVSETLRKYPVLPFLERRCNKDYKIPGSDLIIEENMSIYIPMVGLHYDEEYFPKANVYNPERFNEENLRNIPAGAYLPFGQGPRNCIGERLGLLASKLGIVHILSKFEVLKTDLTPDVLEFEPKSFTLASKVGMPIRFRKLN